MNAGIYIFNDCNIRCKVNMWYFLMIRKYNEVYNEAISHLTSSCLPYIIPGKLNFFLSGHVLITSPNRIYHPHCMKSSSITYSHE